MEGGRGEGAGGPAAADLRRDMAAARAACERRIAQVCERTAAAASAFRRAILSARSLAEHSVAHREKLNTLKDQLRGLEASLTEALSTKLKKESECKLTSELISNATATNEQLRSLVLEQRARRDEFANVISHQLQAIEGLEANVDVIGKKNLEEAIMWYNKFLGFRVVAGEGVKFVFNKVDMQSPDDEYLFCIKVNKDEYSLIQCTPLLKDTDELVKDLNCTNDLFKFVRTMRARFQAAAIKGLFTSPNDIPSSIDNLTPEHIEAAKVFIETLASSKKHIDRNVTRMPAPDGDMCTVKMLHDVLTYRWVNGIVINSYSKHLAHRGLHDRQIMSTWLSTSLLDRADGKKKLLRNKKSRNFAKKIFDRVKDEYFARDKAYFPMHVNKNHWITIVMHTVKEEFQVLNSNGDISPTVRKMIETLRGEIAKDINEANIHVEANKFPDVSSWPIEQYIMPLQTDSVSCGLFVMRCIQHWDGDGWTFSFDQQEINASRPRIVAEILFSHTNELDKVKMELLKIVEKE